MELPSEMPHFIIPNATLRQLKCHTSLSGTRGIRDTKVWHPEGGHFFIFTSYRSLLRSFKLRTLP